MLRPALLVPLIILALAALTWWMLTQVREPERPITERPDSPDYAVERFTATVMDAGGRASYRLQADRMLHFPGEDAFSLDQPYLVVFREEGPPWHIRAEHGWIVQDEDLVRLTGEVTMHRAGEADLAPVDLVTRDVLVRPGAQTAETDAELTVLHGVERLDAEGLRADLAAGHIELLANVRGVYVPAQ